VWRQLLQDASPRQSRAAARAGARGRRPARLPCHPERVIDRFCRRRETQRRISQWQDRSFGPEGGPQDDRMNAARGR